MNPIYAARIARTKADRIWREIDQNAGSTMDQRKEARIAYEKAKSNYRLAFKQQKHMVDVETTYRQTSNETTK